ncbi:MAG: amidohydrolase family protein, partial [Candidatus Bathyarchaeia archaeon]
TSNLELAEFLKEASGRLEGFGSVNLSKDEAYVEGKLKEIDRLGFKGIKLLPPLQFLRPAFKDNLRILFEYCEGRKKIILFHTGCAPGPWEIPELSEAANPTLLRPLLEEFHPVVVLAHAGYYSALLPGIWFEEALQVGKEYPNVYLEVSAVPYILADERLATLVRRRVPFDRILYGSDYIEYMELSINIIKQSAWTSGEEKQKILSLNAERLLSETSAAV